MKKEQTYIVTMLGQKGKREKGPAKIITDPKKETIKCEKCNTKLNREHT